MPAQICFIMLVAQCSETDCRYAFVLVILDFRQATCIQHNNYILSAFTRAELRFLFNCVMIDYIYLLQKETLPWQFNWTFSKKALFSFYCNSKAEKLTILTKLLAFSNIMLAFLQFSDNVHPGA